MIKRLDEYEEYQEGLKEIEKQRVRCESLTKVFEEFEKANLSLDNTLGIKEIGELPDFNKISKSKEKTKIAKREVDIANEKLLSLEEYLKETIEKIRLKRIQKAKAEGLKLNKKVIKAIKTIEKARELYTELHQDIKDDLTMENGSIEHIIGSDFRIKAILNVMNYPTEAFLKRSKIYQSKEKDEIKDI